MEAETALSLLPMSVANLVFLFAILWYFFAAGRIADFLQSGKRPFTLREALLAPFAYVFVSFAGFVLYFSSQISAPPQNTPITLGFYLLIVPAAIAVGLGALVLKAMFKERLDTLEALKMSLFIALSPLFDGVAGYWTALAAAALLAAISGATFWSSGGNFSLVTLDFLLLSIVAACYFLYKAFTAQNSEGRASSLLTALVLLAPGVLRLFFKPLACTLLSFIPMQFFESCPIDHVGNEVTLALSVLATLVLVVPIIPLFYAAAVNLMRVFTLLSLLRKGKAEAKEE